MLLRGSLVDGFAHAQTSNIGMFSASTFGPFNLAKGFVSKFRLELSNPLLVLRFAFLL